MLEYAIKIFVSLFTVMGPFSIVPSFITMSENFTEAKKKKIALKAILLAGLILFICTIIGEGIFKVFGIGIGSFRIAGGILLLLMGINMLNAKTPRTKVTDKELEDASSNDDISVFPLATPLIAGPGAISTVIIHAAHLETKINGVLVILAVVSVCLSILYIFLRYSSYIYKVFGNTGLNIMMRLMGLILSSIAVEQIIKGIKVNFL